MPAIFRRNAQDRTPESAVPFYRAGLARQMPNDTLVSRYTGPESEETSTNDSFKSATSTINDPTLIDEDANDNRQVNDQNAVTGQSSNRPTSRWTSYLPSVATAFTAGLAIAGAAAAAYYYLGQNTHDPTDMYSTAAFALPEDSTPAASSLFSAFSAYTDKFHKSIRDWASGASAATGDLADTAESAWSISHNASTAFSAVGGYAGQLGSSIWGGMTGAAKTVATLGPGMSEVMME